jgi:energy-coupling factor transporter ATP-binding protein EcfA2
MKVRRIELTDIGPFKHRVIDLPAGKPDDRANVVLLTGPNGSGKTTILRALATALSSRDELEGRWRMDSSIELCADLEHQKGVVHFRAELGEGIPRTHIDLLAKDGNKGFEQIFFNSGGLSLFYSGRNDIQRVTGFENAPFVTTYTGPVFSFGAQRVVESSTGVSINDKGHDPFENASSFQPTDPSAFVHWVVSTKTQFALAKADDDLVSAERYDRALKVVENTVSEVTGEEFRIQVTRDPLTVKSSINGELVPLELLPDGLRAMLSWIGDLLRRLDLIQKPNDVAGAELPFIALIDEIDVHLHPEWQRRVLPVAERLFPNAQIFASTHSPFILQSASDACVVRLGANGELLGVEPGQQGKRWETVADEILGVHSSYDVGTEGELEVLQLLKSSVLTHGDSFENFEAKAWALAAKSEDLGIAMRFQIEDLRRKLAAS